MENRHGFRLVLAAVVSSVVLSSVFAAENEPQAGGPRPGGMWKNDESRTHGVGGRRMDGFKLFMDKLKKEQPETYQRLEKLRVSDREAYFSELRKLMPARPMFPNKVGKLEHECQKLSSQYHEARTDGEREAIKKELIVAVENATDAMIADMKERLKMMSERLAELEQNRQGAIDKRVEMLLRKMPPPQNDANQKHRMDGNALPPPPPPLPPPDK
ncbi:MAG: hypothetical protein J6X55_08235 [Victivallales bacterium]|nr:hypothetical protein [Victivallales bacterium]